MSCLARRLDVPGGHRRTSRRPTFVTGSAVSIDGSNSVLIENLSHNGAKLRGRHLPPPGTQILIWMDGLDALGSVVWAKFGERGIVFETPLDVAALMGLQESLVAWR